MILIKALGSSDVLQLIIAIILLLITILLSSLRWVQLWDLDEPISIVQAVKLTLIASSLNIFLPSKMGDLFKIYFITQKNDRLKLLPAVIYEKYLDLFGLSFLCMFGIFMHHLPAWILLIGLSVCSLIILSFILACTFVIFKDKPAGRFKILLFDTNRFFLTKKYSFHIYMVCFSTLIWFLHISQFYLFFRMLGFALPVAEILSKIPLAIYFGLLPVSIAGIGTRDIAIVYLFQETVFFEMCLIVGVLSSARYFLPGLLGMPFFIQDIKRIKEIIKDIKKLLER